MPSFDVVSEVDVQEVRNAIDQAHRELTTRFDFKGTDSVVDLKENAIELESDAIGTSRCGCTGILRGVWCSITMRSWPKIS